MKLFALLGILIAALTVTVMEKKAAHEFPTPAPQLPATSSAPKSEAPPATPKLAPKFTPNVAGKWAGTWESIKNKGNGGTVSCDAVMKGDNEWAAVILAEYGPEMKFNINLNGVCEENKVVFDGKLDLGEEQGVYTWSGSASADEFSGAYKGPGENGVFKMTRVKASAPKAEAASTPTVAVDVKQ